MNRVLYNKYVQRVTIIYIIFSLFFIYSSTVYFYKYFKEKYEKNVEFEKIKFVNLLSSKEQENIAILKEIIDKDLKKVSLSESFSVVKFRKNNDDNFLPIEVINASKTYPITKKALIYSNLVLHKPITIITGEKNKLFVNTFYRLDVDNLYLISQLLVIKNSKYDINPYYVSINDPARVDVDNPLL